MGNAGWQTIRLHQAFHSLRGFAQKYLFISPKECHHCGHWLPCADEGTGSKFVKTALLRLILLLQALRVKFRRYLLAEPPQSIMFQPICLAKSRNEKHIFQKYLQLTRRYILQKLSPERLDALFVSWWHSMLLHTFSSHLYNIPKLTFFNSLNLATD